jgi:hypothetical protein
LTDVQITYSFKNCNSVNPQDFTSVRFITKTSTVDKMAEFVRAQIFGTTFEITSRFAPSCDPSRLDDMIDRRSGTPICNP